MKKLYKLFIAMFSILLILPVLTVQAFDSEAVFKDTIQKNGELKQLDMEGWMSAAIEQDGQKTDIGRLEFAGQVDIDTMQAHFLGEIKSLFLGNDDINIDFYQKDGIIYTYFKGLEGTEQWIKTKDDSANSIKTIKDAQKKSLNDEQVSKLAKYYDVTETDTEYVVSLKKDIDASALWNDLDSIIDFESLKSELLSQMEATGESESQISTAKEMLNTILNPETIAIILKSNPELVTTYKKGTYKPVKAEMKLQLPLLELAKRILGNSAKEEELKSLPSTLSLSSEINYNSVNEPINVTVPEAALNNSSELSTESSSEE